MVSFIVFLHSSWSFDDAIMHVCQQNKIQGGARFWERCACDPQL